ncbi:MAG TPA: dihydrodipicolinate synthase family protein [Anaerolineae bacterium]|nr:dihydrodipicolinate synthase family protein [Anaerolineae bacterium]
MLQLHGILPALVTPYGEDEALDVATLRTLVRHLLPDVDGFLVNGTTADFPLLTHAERQEAIAAVAALVGGQKPVLAGTGAVATREVITLTREAREAGADAALIIAPYYLRPSPAGLERHFATIAAAMPDFPILLYNFPQLVGQPIPPDMVARLAAIPNIIGMKDTSGDLTYMLEVLERVPSTFQVLVGRGTVFLPAMAVGAVGGILACANLIPAQWQKVYRAIRAGDWETARAGQFRAQRVSRIVGSGGSLAVRAGLKMRGIPVGPPRRPLALEGAVREADLAVLSEALG